MQPSIATPQRSSTTAFTARDVGYPAIEAHYGRLAAGRLGTTVVVAKKWQDTDLVWPHSDLDLRIILAKPPADWFSLNERLAQLQRELVTADPVRRRALEHPPGWVFLRREVDAGLVPAADVATWSHSFGDLSAVDKWRTNALARPWSAEDDRFYRGIIAARADGAYRLEADSVDNVVLDAKQYGAHCVSWHYLAPVVFATASLSTHRRLSGKTEALQAHSFAAVARFFPWRAAVTATPQHRRRCCPRHTKRSRPCSTYPSERRWRTELPRGRK